MEGPIQRFLVEDHERLDAWLRKAAENPEAVDTEAYERFRGGLLRHIAMEEKVLLPDARRRRGGEPLPVAVRLRTDHGVLAALLVPTPTPGLLAQIAAVLEVHNPLEEGPHGAYAACEELAGAEAESVLARLKAVPEVPLSRHVDGPRVQEHIANLLRLRAERE